MSNAIFHITQDGTYISREIEQLFRDSLTYKDIKESNNTLYSNFVGFIIRKDNVLVSFPKHFYKKDELTGEILVPEDIHSDIILLFKTLKHTSVIFSKQKLGVYDDLNSSFPMRAFFDIYDYYSKFGLYTESFKEFSSDSRGKIDWNRTINYSPKIISGGNIIFSPLISSKRKDNFVFISQCMAYAINTTLSRLSFLLDYERINFNYNPLYFKNYHQVVRELEKLSQRLFKDTERKLIRNLINFFQNIPEGSNSFKLTTSSFSLIWESILSNYLNSYFKDIDSNGFISFYENKRLIPADFQKISESPDISDNEFRIEPDYYLISENYKLILDAKYYEQITNLNYKQTAYYFLLKHHSLLKNDDMSEPRLIYNILLLPTSNDKHSPDNHKKHFILDKGFNNDEERFEISEQYFNVKFLMENYIK